MTKSTSPTVRIADIPALLLDSTNKLTELEHKLDVAKRERESWKYRAEEAAASRETIESWNLMMCHKFCQTGSEPGGHTFDDHMRRFTQRLFIAEAVLEAARNIKLDYEGADKLPYIKNLSELHCILDKFDDLKNQRKKGL